MNSERIHSIDGLRGFSLLGILLVNMFSFQFDTPFKQVIQDASLSNEIAYYFTKIFAEGTFYPLFSFIFGYSLIGLISSIYRQNLRLYPVLLRRAFGLIVIGLIHYILLWSGDILLNYGLTLLVLLMCIKATPKVRVIVAYVCIGIAVLATGLTYAVSHLESDNVAAFATLEALQYGTYLEVVDNRLLFKVPESLPYIVAVLSHIFNSCFTVVVILPFALFGMNAAQRGDFKVKQVAVASGKLHWIYLVIAGLLLKSCILLDSTIGSFLFVGGGYVLTFGYIRLFIWLFDKLFHARLRKFFTSLGKMSLTNYLVQSLVCTTIFYGYGLGQFGKLGVALGILIAVVLYILQGLISSWYVNHFKQGPVEFVLRKWTYLGRKRQSSAGVSQQQRM